MSNTTKKQTHEFALYCKTLPQKDEAIITDAALVNRIATIIRLQSGQSCILFNQTHNVRFTITSLARKKIEGTISEYTSNKQYTPRIHLLLPILKKESLESAVYSAVEAGVTSLQLMGTQKIKRKWGGQKELDRLERIVIAAAEQSKCFSFPTITAPVTFDQALQSVAGTPIFFADPDGKSIQPVHDDCTLVVGPEGDLTAEEKENLRAKNAHFVHLTPTILRSQMATFLLIGLIRTSF